TRLIPTYRKIAETHSAPLRAEKHLPAQNFPKLRKSPPERLPAVICGDMRCSPSNPVTTPSITRTPRFTPVPRLFPCPSGRTRTSHSSGFLILHFAFLIEILPHPPGQILS